jgi:hypothetical protein
VNTDILKLKIRRCFSRIDWEIEAQMFAQVSNWEAVAYCVLQKPETLLNKAIPGFGLPHNLMIKNHRIDLLKELVHGGTNVSLLDDACERIEKHEKYFWQGFAANSLVAAKLNGLGDVYDYLWPLTSPRGRYHALKAALLRNDVEWIESFDLKSVFAGVADELARQKQGASGASAGADVSAGAVPGLKDFFLEPMPIVLALFGECSIEIVEKIWKASPQIMRDGYHIESPGYGHDNDPVYAGYPFYWAKLLGREDAVRFLSENGSK